MAKSDSIESKLKKASASLNADEEKNDVEAESDVKQSIKKNHHGQQEDPGELSGRKHFNRPEKDRRNNYNADIIARLSSASRGMQKEQGEPEREAIDRDDASDHNSDYFHEKTFANRAEGEAMGRKISAFKRNRSDRGSFKMREVSESKGD